MNWKCLGIIAVLSLLLVGATTGCATRGGNPGRIEVSTTEFDFGTVLNSEPVSQTFQVRNTGKGILEIERISTSCGCTTAEIANPSLALGQVTDLTVTYDPLAHDGATGQFMRIVYIYSDDPDTPEASLTIRVTVVEP